MAEVEELRVQPQDILAEQSVLGAIFIDETKLVFVREYIDSQDFFKYAHRLIFQAMVDLSDRGDAIDATTVRTILDSQGDLQTIGGLSYLVEIVNSVPTSANAEYYAKIVAEKAILRRLIARLTDSINQAYDGASPADEIIAGAVQDTKSGIIVGTKSYGKGTVQSVVQGLDEEGLKITIARYHTPNDRVIDGIGIIPDEIVEPSKANPEVDVQLERAIEIVKTL